MTCIGKVEIVLFGSYWFWLQNHCFKQYIMHLCQNFFGSNATPHVLVDFVVLPPGHDRSVTDFWGWEAHEAQLRCPDNVSGDIWGCSARRALKPKFYQPTQTMVTAEILPFRENSHGRAGNRTQDLTICSQRHWPLDHEAGLYARINIGIICNICYHLI